MPTPAARAGPARLNPIAAAAARMVSVLVVIATTPSHNASLAHEL
jgi:hypothetical protein